MRKRSRKISAVFFLMLFVHSLFTPYYAFGFNSGSHQPEYISYEAPGATDMVNLLTGDFNFNIPILEVPGPEGSFSLPLSYHAGIGPESEASWVGLGFNINPGSIVRSYNQYPDDASGEDHIVTVQDLTGARGWTSSLLGLGQIGWDSQMGHYGYISLLGIVNYGYDSKGASSVGLVGINVGREGPSFNAVQFGAAVIAIVSYGTAAPEAASVSVAATAIAKQAAIDVAVGAAVSLAMPSATPEAPSSQGYWRYTSDTKQKFLHKDYWIWIDDSRTEHMYGVLYAGDTPLQVPGGTSIAPKLKINNGVIQDCPVISTSGFASDEGPTMDINFNIDQRFTYNQQNTATALASDDYTVNGPGISGSISPYRLEIGSVAMPRNMTSYHKKYMPISYLDDYKVPFMYDGMFSNSYYHHLGGSEAVDLNFYYGLDIVLDPGAVYYDLHDTTFDSNLRINPDLNTIKRVPQGNHIEWLSNNEIKSALAASQVCPQGFIDFLSGAAGDYTQSERYKFRSSYSEGPLPSQGIGGYSITGVDGVTYHYALPVYDHDYKSESIDVHDDQKKSTMTRTAPFANTWLLTAITGPDFIDRNTDGLADDGDWGYWVKFNYGKYSDSFSWRNPYQDYLLDPAGGFNSYEQGKKQLYYLNSIETRSHVGLFMKSRRVDAMAVNAPDAPFKLDEICLLQKEQYKKLLQAPYNIATYTNKISTLCLSSQYTTAAIRDFINKNCIKRIIFNYSYDLCKNSPGGAGVVVNPQSGKLTLEGVSIRGRNDLKVVPDYEFDYARNPNYGADAWDGWGMYSLVEGHQTYDPNGTYGASWSLTRVGTPLGSDILINYERDTYSSISGEPVLDPPVQFSASNYDHHGALVDIPLPSGMTLQVGDKVRLVGDISYHCSDGSTPFRKYDDIFTVSSVSATSFNVDREYANAGCFTSGTMLHVDGNAGTISKVQNNKSGGNIRVGSIVMRESGKENKIRYLYTNDDDSSSGVVAQEPSYIRNENLISDDYLEFYKYLNYPQTPVIYGKVTVLSGNLATDADYHTKQIFEFVTPDKSLYDFQEQDMGSDSEVHKMLYEISDRTSEIGSLVSVKVYDKTGIVSTSQMDYTETLLNDQGVAHQGIFTQGTMLTDFSTEAGPNEVSRRINRTSIIKYPHVLKKVTNSHDGFSSTTENLKWDALTGSVTERLDKSPLGLYVKTVTQPAYSVKVGNSFPYQELGSKAYASSNKNMLSQNAATYVYKSNALGNELGLMSGTVQTWRKDGVKYRALSGGAYVDDQGVYGLWHKGPSYVWRGEYARLNPDGTQTFSASDKFVFGGSNPLWQNVGESTRFDYYGMPLEAVNMSGIYSATKVGYDNRVVVATASNAKYNEIAFSSAEDKIEGQPYFGGEVGLGDGSVITSQAHTGQSALSLASGYGFVFKTQEATQNRSYRVSVWASNTNGKIYYKVNGGTEQLPTQTASSPVEIDGANWYRIDAVIPKSAVTSSTLEVGVKSASGTVVFDDFRFQPLDAAMHCYVYNPLNFEFTTSSATYSLFSYSLDNDNLFTKFEYNEKGALVKTYSESLKYGVKQTGESRYNYKRTTVTP